MDENMQLKRMDEYDHTNEWLNLWMDGCPGGHQVAGKEEGVGKDGTHDSVKRSGPS